MEIQQTTLFTELRVTWKWASIIFGNVMAVILFLTWWNGEQWVRADSGAIVEMSRAMGEATRRR